jgi:serine/threonine-protein kinase
MDFVAGGLAEEVASALSRVPGIQIKSRSGARAYRGKLAVDVAEVGARLKADYVMTGEVRQERGRWILSANLERAADASTLWDQGFNVGPDQQAGAADAIARSLTAELRRRFPKLIGSAPVLRPNQQTENNEAYLLYLSGKDKLSRRSRSVRQSADLFRDAIHQDTLYAQAWSGLSMALALSPAYEGIPARDIHHDLLSAARRALELDSTLAQPHVALGMAYGFEHQWDSAATEFRTAIRLDGHDVDARYQYARHLRNWGRLPEAIVQMRAARAEEPLSAPVLSQMSYVLYLDHQLDSALAEFGWAWKTDSNSMPTIGNGALLMLALNRRDEARKLADLALPVFSIKEYLIAKSGDPATARRGLQKLDAETPQPWMAETRRAYAYLGLGDTAKALSAMERALDAKEDWPGPFSLFDPMFDPVRGSTRFQKLLRRVRLSP